MAGKSVTVTWDTRDRYGRIVGWVLAPDGRWVNLIQMLTGMAWRYEQYSKDEDSLRDAEAVAREKRLGLWAEEGAVEPWNWRKRKSAIPE